MDEDVDSQERNTPAQSRNRRSRKSPGGRLNENAPSHRPKREGRIFKDYRTAQPSPHFG
jgi:hypothetical protein